MSKNTKKIITLHCPIHRACGSDEQPLFRYDCVRILPIPGSSDGKAVACAVDGRIVAAGLAESNVVALLPSHVPPKTMSGPWSMTTEGEVGGLVAGRHNGKQNDGLLVYEATGDPKLAIGVDQIAAAQQRVSVGGGQTVTIDAAELLKVATAISSAAAGSKPGTVTLYVEDGKPLLVLGSQGIGIVPHDADTHDRHVFADVFSRMCGFVHKAFSRDHDAEAKARGGRTAKRAKKGGKS